MATLSLVQHYVDYLLSPPIILATLIVVGPILFQVFKSRALPQKKSTSSPPAQGCFRLGLSKRSNLEDQYRQDSIASNLPTSKACIKALFTYPIKSCRGVQLSASEVGATGLKYDRLFTFAQLVSKQETLKPSDNDTVEDVSGDWKHEWRFMTQRDFPRLALLTTELWVPDPRTTKKAQVNGLAAETGRSPKRQQGRKAAQDLPAQPRVNQHPMETSWSANGGCLIVRFPFEPDFNPFSLRTETITIRIPLAPNIQRAKAKEYSREPLTIWKDCPQVINVTNEISSGDLEKLKYFLGVSNPLGFFRVDDSNQRAVTRCLPKDRPGESYSVGFADAFPLHVLNLASVRALDEEIPEKAKTLKGKLDARRFRANIYITGPSAYTEDSWKKVNIGRCIKSQDQAQRDQKNDKPGSTGAKGVAMVEVEGEYHVACRTARCKLPNVNPDTGIKDVNEPYTTLGRTRKVDKGAYPHPCLGMQMVPLFQQGILRVGDEVEVRETGEHCYEKMFT